MADRGIDQSDNNAQRRGRKTEGGERRAGRLSTIKNDKLEGDEYPTLYTNPEHNKIT